MLIQIENKFKMPIQARINTDGESKEEWQCIDINEVEKWKRKEGQYQLELGIKSDNNSIPTVYDVKPSVNYYIDQDGLLRYTEGNSLVGSSGFSWTSNISPGQYVAMTKMVSIIPSDNIKISNDSKRMLHVRVSGEDENFVDLPIGSTHTWIRPANSSYHIEYSLVPEPNKGPVLILRPGDAYSIDKSLDLLNSKGDFVPPALGFFVSKKEEEAEMELIESQNKVLLGKDSESQESHGEKVITLNLNFNK
jgi:hypothetical protein